MNANDRQVGGGHYKVGFEHWDFVHLMGLGYFEGQITKYVTRHRKKNGRQDAEKALHFLDKLIELQLQGGVWPPVARVESISMDSLLTRYRAENGLTPQEAAVIGMVSTWISHVGLRNARRDLLKLIEVEYGDQPGPGYVNQDRP